MMNFGSLWMAVVNRASSERLMTAQEVVGSKQFLRMAIASMAFSGGGNTSVKALPGTTGPKLSSTSGNRTGYRVSEGLAGDETSGQLKQQLYRKNLDQIAAQDVRLARAVKGNDGEGINFPLELELHLKPID